MSNAASNLNAPSIYSPLSFNQFQQNFLAVLAAESAVQVSQTPGSIPLALANALSANDLFVQSLVSNVSLISRLTTSTGTDIDSFVNQFSPPFTPRQQAVAAYSYPTDPTTLSLAATATVLTVGTSTGLVANQNLTLTNGANTATTTISTVNPVVNLSTAAAPGATVLYTTYTPGILQNTSLTLLDSGYTTTTTVNGAPTNQIAAPAITNGMFTPSTTGGSLPAGTYLAKMTLVNGNGETTVSNEATIIVGGSGAGSIAFNFGTTLGTSNGANVNGKLYLTAAGGASGSETYDATVPNGGTVTITAAPAGGAPTPPTVNTTGLVVPVPATAIPAGHTYAVNASVTANNTLIVNPAIGTPSNFPAGTVVTPTNMLQGLLVARNVAAPTTPSVAVGTQAVTPIGAIAYQVVADTNHPQYNSAQNAYVLPANVASMNVPIQAVLPGTASNVLANQLTVLPLPIAGIDSVTNQYAISNGVAQESDNALILRFQQFIQSLSDSTLPAIQAAITSAQPNIIYNIIENVANDGVTTQYGRFLVIASDQSGNLSNSLLSSLNSVIQQHKALSVQFAVVPPVVVNPAFAIKILVTTAFLNSQATVAAAVQNAIYNFFTATASGATLLWDNVVFLIEGVTGVADILSMTINGNGFSLTPTQAYTVIGAGPIDLSAGPLQLLRPSLANIVVTY